MPSDGNVISMDAGAADKMNRSFSGDPQLAVKTMKVIFEREMPANEEVSYNNSPAVSQFRTGIWSTVGDQTQSAGFTGLLTGVKNGKAAPAPPQPPKQNDDEQAARAVREKEKRQQELERQQREQAEFEEQQQEYERRRRERAELARQQHYQNHNDQPRNSTNEAGLSPAEIQREELERAEYERQQREYERKLAEYQKQQAEYEKQQAEYEKQQAEYERQQTERAEDERQQAERAELERQQAERLEFERQQAARVEFERQQAELESHQAETITHAIDENDPELQNLSEEERAEYLAQLREFELQRAEYEQIKMEVEGEHGEFATATGMNPELKEHPEQQYEEPEQQHEEPEQQHEEPEQQHEEPEQQHEEPETTQVEQASAAPEVTGEALISKFMDQLFDSSNMESGPEYSVEFDPASANSLEQMHANLHSSGSQGMLAEQISNASTSTEQIEQTASGSFRMQNSDRQAAFGAVTMESVKDTNFESSMANQHVQSFEQPAPQATPRDTNSSIDKVASKSNSTDTLFGAKQDSLIKAGDNYYSSPDIEKFGTGTFNSQADPQTGSGSYRATTSNDPTSKEAVDDQQDDLYQTSEQQKLRRDMQSSSGNRDFTAESSQTTSGKFENQISSGRNQSFSPPNNSEMRKTTGGIFNMDVEVSSGHLNSSPDGASAMNDAAHDGRLTEPNQQSSANQLSPRASNSRIFPYDSAPDKTPNEGASGSEGLRSPLLSKQPEKQNKPPANAFKKVVLPLVIATGAFAFLAGIMLLRVPTGLTSVKDKPAVAGKGAPSPSDVTPSEQASTQATVREGTQTANNGTTGPAEVAPIGSNSTGETPNLLDVANGTPQAGAGLNMVQNSHTAQPMQQMPTLPMQQMPMQQMPTQPMQQMPAPPMQQMPAQPMQQMPAQPMQQMPAQPMQQMPAQPMQQMPAQPMQQAQSTPAQPMQKPNPRPQALMKVETTSMTGKWDYGYQNPTGSTGYGAIQIKQDGVNLRGSGTDSSGAFQIKGVRQGDIITFDKLYVRNGVAISKRIVYSGKLSIYNEPGAGPAMLMSGIWRYSGQDANGKEKTMSGQFEGKLAR